LQRPPEPDHWPALTITNITQFRVDATHGVYVVTAEDPGLAERTLLPLYDGGVCVVASRYTPQQLEQIRHRLHEEMRSRAWPITMHGDTSDADGQPMLIVQLAWVVPGMVEWAATLPDGILYLEAWLRPAV